MEASSCWTDADRDRILAELADNLWRYVGRHACAVPAATRQKLELLVGKYLGD